MRLKGGATRLHVLKIEGGDFAEQQLRQTGWSFIIVPGLKERSSAFRILSETGINSPNGSSLEFICEVTFFFNNSGRQPALAALAMLAESSLSIMNAVFKREVLSRTTNLQSDGIAPFKRREMLEILKDEINGSENTLKLLHGKK
jgi:hypothetical protein